MLNGCAYTQIARIQQVRIIGLQQGRVSPVGVARIALGKVGGDAGEGE